MEDIMIFRCPKCEQSLEFDKEFIGELFRCPICKSYLKVISIYSERSTIPKRACWNLTDVASGDEPKEPIDSTSFPLENARRRTRGANNELVGYLSEKDFQIISESGDEKYKIFIDVETSKAPGDSGSEITTICWWMDGRWGAYVAGIDSPNDFIRSWNQSRLLVTFCGKMFYEKYITKKFKLRKHPYHIDLHNFHNGNLLDVTKKFGFKRPKEFENEDCMSAAKYWSLFTNKGDVDALRKLLYYNSWNVILIYRLYKHVVKQSVEDEIVKSVHFKQAQAKPFIYEVFVDPHCSKSDLQILWQERREQPLKSLKGAEVCFAGKLDHVTREELGAIVVASGGFLRSTSLKTLDFLVVGNVATHNITSIQKKVQEGIEQGAHTQIINENDFWKLVPEKFR
jgi:uncharacterized protein YprB with RNaseH-like and TPR domain